MEPDLSVSHPGRAAIGVGIDTSDFALAIFSDGERTLYWGGGVLPLGMNSVMFAFPDGHTQAAIVEQGHWVIQYFQTEPNNTPPQVYVTITGPVDSRKTELVLEEAEGLCNQIVGGC